MDVLQLAKEGGAGVIGVAVVIVLFVGVLRHILKVFTEQAGVFTAELKQARVMHGQDASAARSDFREELALQRDHDLDRARFLADMVRQGETK